MMERKGYWDFTMDVFMSLYFNLGTVVLEPMPSDKNKLGLITCQMFVGLN